MKHIIKSLLALMLATAPLGALAGIDDLPVTTVGGKQYHYYDVQPKQTVYSICNELGITKARLFETNPSVAEDGLKAFQRLLFPIDSPSPDIHVVGNRETIYGISHRYGITPSQLEEWNPGVRDGVRPGDRLVVSDPAKVEKGDGSDKSDKSDKSDAPAYTLYTVKARETFYSIAHSNGISVAELEAANPEVTLLREGQQLRIPAPKGEKRKENGEGERLEIGGEKRLEIGEHSDISDISQPSQPSQSSQPSEPSQAPEQREDVNIAVVLPFKLGSEHRGRKAELMTEWYKGFLLAVDSMRHSSRPIHIQTYDTEGTDEGLSRIMLNPDLAKAQVIVAPDNAEQLERLAAYGTEKGIDVLNLFVVADRSYATTPSLFQATIPHDAMYESAVTAMLKQIEDGFTPVVLKPSDGSADKQSFVDQLTDALRRHGVDYRTVEYDKTLTLDDLEGLDRGGRYAFIPNTASQADLNRILPTLIELRSAMTDTDPMRLYGYPEWTTFRGETLTNMHGVNTYVYSRFFTSPDDPWAKQVEEAFERWYGTPMAAAVPRQGLLGFDTGMFLVSTLRSGMRLADAPVFHGVQNAFRFVRPKGIEGNVNDDLYFVNFRPSGLTDRISL